MDKALLSFSTSIEDLPEENWQDIPNFETLYKISTYGRIKSLAKSKNGYKEIIYDVGISNNGYKNIQLSKNGVYQWFGVHVLMGLTFLDNPENKPVVNHKNTIKFDNTLENLEWATHLENILHAIESGVMKSIKGEANFKAVLNSEQVLDIISSNLSSGELCDKYNVDRVTINAIKSGYTWSHLTKIKYTRKKLLPNQVLDIFNCHATEKEISMKFNVSRSVVNAIKTGQNGSRITGKIYNPKKSKF